MLWPRVLPRLFTEGRWAIPLDTRLHWLCSVPDICRLGSQQEAAHTVYDASLLPQTEHGATWPDCLPCRYTLRRAISLALPLTKSDSASGGCIALPASPIRLIDCPPLRQAACAPTPEPHSEPKHAPQGEERGQHSRRPHRHDIERVPHGPWHARLWRAQVAAHVRHVLHPVCVAASVSG